jgi:hypothetical protein
MAKRKDGSVYLLQHSYETLSGDDEVKTIGIYSTNTNAIEAIERLNKQPGFRDLPECFIVDKYDLDKDHWTEGFVVIVNPESDDSDWPAKLTRHFVRPAPDGYTIFELIKEGKSLGCEVFVVNGNAPMAKDLGYEEAYTLAEKDKKMRSAQ